jgi:hypothetical protein
MTPGQPFHFDVWFSYDDVLFWDSERPDPIWSSDDYSLSYTISEKNKLQLNLTLPMDDFYSRMHLQNETLYLHYEM